MRAALAALRQRGVGSLVVAAPVRRRMSLSWCAAEADRVVVLASPEQFVAVGPGTTIPSGHR